MWGRGSQGVGEGITSVWDEFTVWGLTECWEGLSVCGGLTECGEGLTCRVCGEGLTGLTKCLCSTGSFSFSSFISFLNAPPETVTQFLYQCLEAIIMNLSESYQGTNKRLSLKVC